MKFSEIVRQASILLKDKGQISYRMLKREFDLDDEALEDLKAELIEVHRLAVDEDGKVLVWVGAGAEGEKGKWGNGEKEGVPGQWTPPHLAERIRAVNVTEGERKTITALFADLKGSTALIDGLDPEEARTIIDPALQVMMDAVHRYEGYVAQALGDGIFALFGAPIAHEDHPQRALYAALRMQEEMRRYGDQVRLKHGVPLVMRVGINTGEVVVRSIRKDDLHTDYVPVGHSTNLAARMEQMATPGSILVAAYTYKLTEGYFAFKALGQTQIKGVEEPLHVYEVLGTGPLRTRLQVTATRRGLTRFVGRQSELEQLQKALEQAKAGHGQIVGVMGEPGLGKSRLFYEFKLLSQSGSLVLEAYSVSHGKASPYLPVIELLKSYFDIQPSDDERKRQEKVTGKVLRLDRSLEDTLPYVFALLAIEEQPSPLQQMDPQIRRRRTWEAFKKLFLRESLNQPLILIFEDLHWIDTETQGFLDTLSESVASAKVLLLVNYRPEYRPEWGQKTYYTQLRLAPLGKAEAEELLTALLGTDPQLSALKLLILEKTEGTPFFMEEMVQTLIEEEVLAGERGNFQLKKVPTESLLSPTVQGVLAARIDRLGADEKELLHQLAVIGREFPVSLVRHVVPQSEGELYRLLASLQRKEFLYEQPAFPETEYTFKHALTQEVAYNSVLHERRKPLHERTAQAIELLYSAGLADHYSELAHHYRRSGNTQKAVAYLHLAGQQAGQRSAYAEAIGHLSTALELLRAMPESPEHIQQELALQTLLGQMLMITKGQAAAETGVAFSRAYDLCRQSGDTPQLFSVLAGLRRFYSAKRDLQTARELAQQMLSLAQRARDPALLVEAHHSLGNVLFWSGEFVAAQAQVEQGIACHDPQQHRRLAFWYGIDPGVNCRNFAANALWFLGYPNQALKRSPEALTLARELAHPHSQAYALGFAATLHQHRREEQPTKEQAEVLITLATEHGFQPMLAWGTVLRGWAVARQGHTEEGIAQIRQGLAAAQDTGTERLRWYLLTLLAEAHENAGQIEQGLSVLADVLAMGNEGGGHIWEAEGYRLKGALTLQSKVQGPRSEVEKDAEECFLKAIEISRHQQAKALELRASMSLVRLWQSQGRKAEAHKMLSEVYNWFTEGFDTKDLQEAKALLDQLTEGR